MRRLQEGSHVLLYRKVPDSIFAAAFVIALLNGNKTNISYSKAN
jgi:hypothetical protein